MKDILRNLGPGTQLMFLMLIAFFTLFLMQIIAFLVIRPIWQVNIFESASEIGLLKDEASIHMTKVLQVFYHIGMFLLPAIVFSKIFGNADRPFFVLENRQPSLIWMAAIVFFLLAYPLINALHVFNLSLPVGETLISEDAASTELLKKLLGGESAFWLLVNIFIYAFIPAIGEELLFRGVIMRQLALSTKNVHLAVWVSAAFFSFIHGEATVFIPRLLMGAALGYMFVWTGNIWVGVVAHFFNNLLGIVVINSILNDRLDPHYEMFGANNGEWIFALLSLLITAGIIWQLYRLRNNSYRRFIEEHTTEIREEETNDPE